MGKWFWALLKCAMQMCLILLTGYIVAVSPPVKKGLAWLASLPNPDKPWQAILLMGLGCVWHVGLSASAPLMVPDPESFLIKEGILTEPIPTNRTIFSPFNLGITAFTIIFTAAFMAIMHPRPEKTLSMPPERLKVVEKWVPPEKPRQEEVSVADKISWWPGWGVIFGIMAAVYLVWWYSQKGFAGLTLDYVNSMFLFAALLLHWYPAWFVDAALSGDSKVWGIIIQFPLYGGIFGMLKYTALAKTITDAFVAMATAPTYPLLMYWVAGTLNLLRPLGRV